MRASVLEAVSCYQMAHAALFLSAWSGLLGGRKTLASGSFIAQLVIYAISTPFGHVPDSTDPPFDSHRAPRHVRGLRFCIGNFLYQSWQGPRADAAEKRVRDAPQAAIVLRAGRNTMSSVASDVTHRRERRDARKANKAFATPAHRKVPETPLGPTPPKPTEQASSHLDVKTPRRVGPERHALARLSTAPPACGEAHRSGRVVGAAP